MYQPTRSFISIVHFNNAVYNYSNKSILDKSILFTLNSEATIDNCPPGRILYDTGHTLIPRQTGLTYTMVSIFDTISGLSGYINPKSYHFIEEKITDGPKVPYKGVINISSIVSYKTPLNISQYVKETTNNEISTEEISTEEISTKEYTIMGSELIESDVITHNKYYVTDYNSISYSICVIGIYIAFIVQALIIPYLLSISN